MRVEGAVDVAPIRCAENTLTKDYLLLNRGTVEDRSLWKKVASTPWRASLVMDFPKRISRLTSIRLMLVIN